MGRALKQESAGGDGGSSSSGLANVQVSTLLVWNPILRYDYGIARMKLRSACPKTRALHRSFGHPEHCDVLPDAYVCNDKVVALFTAEALLCGVRHSMPATTQAS